MHHRPTILCVDDEANVLEVLTRMFQRQFRVLTASSGKQALELLRSEKISLLLTDQKMPEMTGIELVRAARAEGIEVVTILLTAYTNPSDLIAAINEGQVYRYVTKPWDVNDLNITVRNAMEMVTLRQDKERLLGTLRKRLEALSVMYEVSRHSARDAASLDGIVDRLLSTLGRVLPHDVSAVLVETADNGNASLRIRRSSALTDGALVHVKDAVLLAHRKTSGQLLPEERVITNVSAVESTAGGEIASFPSSLTVPLVSGGHTVGTLALFSAHPEAYDNEDGELLDLLVNQTTDAITHVRAAERDARLRVEQMVETMSDGVVLTDEKGEVVVVNAAARTHLRLPATGDRVTLDLLTAQLGLSPFEMVRGWEYGGQKVFRDQVTLNERAVELVVSPVVDQRDALRGVLVVLHDVTAQRQLEQRKDEFVSIVSHELRTPLTSITGALDLVLANMAGDLTEKQRRFLDMARESSDRLNALVDDLLDLSKFASGRMRMSFEFTHLDELIRDAVEKYGPACASKGIALNVDLPDAPLNVLADPNRVTQVLNNLITNAMKFCAEGGQVRVGLSDSPDTPGYTTLTVWNSGAPIAEDNLERIFDRFEQARTATNHSLPGTGLGLSICRNIVEAHGGRVWAEPATDGARFVVVLPVEANQYEDGQVPAQRSDLPPRVRGTVLVVDDQPQVAFLMKAVLIDAGFKVVVAGTGEEALTLARKHRPDVITLDHRLPDVEGLALLDIFRHDPDTAESRVLVVSGMDLRDDAMRVGASGFLQKPLQRDALVAAVEGILAASNKRRGRVLVVDDDPQIAAICVEVLSNMGFELKSAGTLAQARIAVKEFRPDLLLLDLMLPDGDGFSFFEETKAERASGLMPVIFISARGDTSAKVRALKLGGDDYLTKPFDALELGARVETVLRRRSADSLASPTTRLPGSGAIEREVQQRIASKQPFAFCYLDLDNLKAYNDYYGFAKADGVVRQTGDLLREVFAQHAGSTDFVGHVAGDDFVFITRPELVDTVCERFIQSFDRIIPLYYDRSDRERGYIEAEDRYGQRRKFSLMSVSIVAVMADGTLSHPELARAAAEMKHRAKGIAGSVYLRSDRPEGRTDVAEGA